MKSSRLRGVVRLVQLFVLTLFCGSLSMAAKGLRLFHSDLSRRVRRAITKFWFARGVGILHMRFHIQGTPPPAPYFVVLNHMAWFDMFAVGHFLDVTLLAEEDIAKTPFVGAIVGGVNPIWVRRVKDATAQIVAQMDERLAEGESLLLCPESPVRNLKSGSGVLQFRGGLLQAAVNAKKPVHYFSVSYTTPEGCPPAAEVLLSGPNPWTKKPDGTYPPHEIEMCGPEKNFLRHVLDILSLPYFDFHIHYAEKPIPPGDDRIVLANTLHAAVTKIFVPLAR